MNEGLSMTQRAALAGASEERRADIEYESSMWMVACACGWEQSVWDLGGVRSAAQGDKTERRRCEACGKRELHQVYYAGDGKPSPTPMSSPEFASAVATPAGAFAPASKSEAASEAEEPDALSAARAGMSFGTVFVLLAVAKIAADRLYPEAVPSWFLVFIVAGAIAGSGAKRRRRRRRSVRFGFIVAILLAYLIVALFYTAKMRELT
jgi:prepilin signal peptidase PulO-like enzyme (type II secretory pathway)